MGWKQTSGPKKDASKLFRNATLVRSNCIKIKQASWGSLGQQSPTRHESRKQALPMRRDVTTSPFQEGIFVQVIPTNQSRSSRTTFLSPQGRHPFSKSQPRCRLLNAKYVPIEKQTACGFPHQLFRGLLERSLALQPALSRDRQVIRRLRRLLAYIAASIAAGNATLPRQIFHLLKLTNMRDARIRAITPPRGGRRTGSDRAGGRGRSGTGAPRGGRGRGSGRPASRRSARPGSGSRGGA
jgi:hypothetical protein